MIRKVIDITSMRRAITGQLDANEGSTSGPQPPDNGDMEHRVTALETRLDTILPLLATKGDMAEVRAEVAKSASEAHKGFSDIVKWIVGISFTGLAVLISAMTFLSRPQQPQSQQPLVITVPANPAAPAATDPAAPAAPK